MKELQYGYNIVGLSQVTFWDAYMSCILYCSSQLIHLIFNLLLHVPSSPLNPKGRSIWLFSLVYEDLESIHLWSNAFGNLVEVLAKYITDADNCFGLLVFHTGQLNWERYCGILRWRTTSKGHIVGSYVFDISYCTCFRILLPPSVIFVHNPFLDVDPISIIPFIPSKSEQKYTLIIIPPYYPLHAKGPKK